MKKFISALLTVFLLLAIFPITASAQRIDDVCCGYGPWMDRGCSAIPELKHADDSLESFAASKHWFQCSRCKAVFSLLCTGNPHVQPQPIHQP